MLNTQGQYNKTLFNSGYYISSVLSINSDINHTYHQEKLPLFVSIKFLV